MISGGKKNCQVSRYTCFISFFLLLSLFFLKEVGSNLQPSHLKPISGRIAFYFVYFLSFASPVTPAEGGPIYPRLLRFKLALKLVVSHSLRVDSENARHPPLLQSLQICLNLGYSLITLRESCNYQLPSFRLKQ